MIPKCSYRVLKAVSRVITVLAISGILIPLLAPASLAQNPSSDSSLFLPAVTYATGAPPTEAVAIADVNGDGYLDLIVTSYGATSIADCTAWSGTVSVLLNNGDGTFRGAQTYCSGGLGEGDSIAVADINGDGKPDILVGNTSKSPDEQSIGAVGVLLGNGDGTFQPTTVYDYVWGTSLLGVADVNGDGKPDLIVTACGSGCGWPGQGGVSIWLGRGDGTFQPPTTFASGGENPRRGEISDFNGDGNPDLVVPNFDSETLSVLLGNGDGTFEAAVTYDVGVNPSVAVADVNADGKLDLIVANLFCTLPNICGLGKVRVLLGNGDGTFQKAMVAAPFSTDTYVSIAVADVDGDGKPDVIAAGYTQSPIGAGIVDVLFGNGDGTFQPAITFSSGSDREAYSVKVADVNGDGKPDLVVGNDWYFCHQCGLAVLLNNSPSCTTAPTVTLSLSPTTLWPPNGNFTPVNVSGTITATPGCTVTSAGYAVTDEYGRVQPRGSIAVGTDGAYSFVVSLEASRLGNDLDGRLYSVTVSASNNVDKTGSQTGTIVARHDQGR